MQGKTDLLKGVTLDKSCSLTTSPFPHPQIQSPLAALTPSQPPHGQAGVE